jgi:hypothetical protein
MRSKTGRLAKSTGVCGVVAFVALLTASCTQTEPRPSLPSASTTNLPLRYGSRYHLPEKYAQLEAAYQRHLDEVAISHIEYGMASPPPSASFVRFVRPDEVTQVMVDCLDGKGVSASLGPDGGVQFAKYPADQTPTVLAADFSCQVEYPIDPKYTAPLTQVQIAAFYDYYVHELVPCLAAEGYTTDPGTIPTLSTFAAAFGTKMAWTPYQVVEDRRIELEAANGGVQPAEWAPEWKRLNSTCPQSPPLGRLYPS